MAIFFPLSGQSLCAGMFQYKAQKTAQRMADSVMEIAFKQNSEIFAKISSEGDMLKLNALRFLFEDEINRARADAEVQGEASFY